MSKISLKNILKKTFKKKKSTKINILFITVNLTSGQGESRWTPQNRNKMISQLIEEIQEHKEYRLQIKIHPTNEKLSDYEKITQATNSNVKVFQNEDIYEIIEKSDIIITSSSSTAAGIALILDKPMVIWNYFDVKNDLFLKHKIALECKNSKNIIDCLTNVENFNKKQQIKKEEFIEKFFGKGNALQNIVREIEKNIK